MANQSASSPTAENGSLLGKEFEETVARLERVNEVVASLDGAIKVVAFEVLRPFVVAGFAGGSSGIGSSGQKLSGNPASGADDLVALREFIARQTDSGPSDSVYALVAWLYSRYGIEPFKATEIQSLANDAGLTVPHRVDMTLNGMQRDGKRLLQRTDRGTYRITVHGEIFLREKYQVQKGTVKRIVES